MIWLVILPWKHVLHLFAFLKLKLSAWSVTPSRRTHRWAVYIGISDSIGPPTSGTRKGKACQLHQGEYLTNNSELFKSPKIQSSLAYYLAPHVSLPTNPGPWRPQSLCCWSRIRQLHRLLWTTWYHRGKASTPRSCAFHQLTVLGSGGYLRRQRGSRWRVDAAIWQAQRYLYRHQVRASATAQRDIRLLL